MVTRDEWKEVEKVLGNPDVQIAMRGRCEEQGHEWENCCSILMQIYQECKWCGERR